MNEIVNEFLLVGDKFMPETQLRQPGFTRSARGPFIKTKKRINKFKETGDLRYIYQNELDKACFQHDVAYGDLRDLNRRTFVDSVLRNETFNITNDPKYDGCEKGLALMVCRFFGKMFNKEKTKKFLIKN